MNNIILNIVSKKQNLSYPFIFSKISKYFWNPYIAVKFYGSMEEMQLLCMRNNYHKIIKFFNKQQLLYFCCCKGYFNTIKYLIEKPQEIDIHTNNEMLLRYACLYGNLDMVKYCIENKADVSSKHHCAIKLAAIQGHIEIVQYLVENGVVN